MRLLGPMGVDSPCPGALGRPKEPQDVDVLAMVRESVKLGLASYPLSPTHYKELTAGASPRQSHELAPVIAEISCHHTMIGPGNDVLSEELDRYLQKRFGRPRGGQGGAGVRPGYRARVWRR